MRSLLIVLALLFAHIAHAQVFISEIKYTGNEWIEIANNGEPVDIASWKFFEGGTNHKLKPVHGSTTIPTGGYAIIANDSSAFLSEYSGYSGALFDSSFSLLDAGETISIKSSDTVIADTVTYTGTKGSKNSLQKINGVWKEAVPNPGAASNTLTSIGVRSSREPAPFSPVAPLTVEARVSAENGAQERTGFVGVPVLFETNIHDTKGQPIANARAVWSFGDGASAEGLSVSHPYYYPGDYIVVLDVSSSEYSGSTRIVVHVVTPTLALRTGGDTMRSFVAIDNKGDSELDLSGWHVRVGGKDFTVLKNTFLSAHKVLTLASEVTGLVSPAGSNAELFFANGTKIETRDSAVGDPTVQKSTPTPESMRAVASAQKSRKSPQISLDPERQNIVQQAAVSNAISEPMQSGEEGSMWIWYTGVAFLGTLAVVGLRFVRQKTTPADEYEIIEEKGEEKNDLF